MNVTASFGGEGVATLQLPATSGLLKRFEGKLYGKVSVRTWAFSFDTEGAFKGCYVPGAACTPGFASALNKWADSEWHLTPRTYVTDTYAQFKSESPQLERSTARLGAISLVKNTLVSNVYPDAKPSLTVWGDAPKPNALVVWSHDDPNKPLGLGTDLLYSRYDGATWSAPTHITDDLVPDLQPQVVNDGQGHLVAVWTRIPNASIQDTLDSSFSRKIELAYAVYTVATGTWSAPQLLTQNSALDFSLSLVAGADGAVLATWMQNDAGTLTSTPTTPSQLKAAFWNGATWSAPRVIAMQVDEAAAALRDGKQGSVLLSRDDDGNRSTVADQHLFISTWNGNSWGAETPLATGSNFNGLQAIYPSDGTPLFTWNGADGLVSQYGAIRSMLTASEGAELVDTKLVGDRQGNALLLYQSSSPAGVDLQVLAYNAHLRRCGMPKQLTNDRTMEDSLAPIFASDGTLWVGLLDTDLITDTAMLDGITVPNALHIGSANLDTLQARLDWDALVAADGKEVF